MTGDGHDLEMSGRLLGVVDLDPFSNELELAFQLDAEGDAGATRVVVANIVPPVHALADLPGTAVTADDAFFSEGESIGRAGYGQLVRDGHAELVDVRSVQFGELSSGAIVSMTMELSTRAAAQLVTVLVTATFDGVQVRSGEHEDQVAAVWDVRSYERVESDAGILFRPVR